MRLFRTHVLLRNSRRAGFTLIELVVVLLIVAGLAGLVIPNISMITRTSDMAATAKTQADLANNMQLFFTLQKRFPQGLDSLLEAGATAVYGPKDGAGAATTNGDLQATGLPASGPSLYADLTVGELTNVTGTAEYLRSFSRCGFDKVYDHDRAVVNSNNSATLTNERLTTTSPFKVAEVTSGSVVAKKLMPGTNGVPATGTRLVALGIGPNCALIPKTMTSVPTYPGCDGKYYGRYVAIFQVYATGERATLVGVVDSYGRNPDYSIQQFKESLPDGGRQG